MNASELPPVGPRDIHAAAQRFVRERLTLARELRGFTKAALAALIDKTPSAVSQFELDRTRPDAQTVAALSLALTVPVGFFASRNGPAIRSDGAHFRSLRAATERERRIVLSWGSLLCEAVAVIEEFVDWPAISIPSALKAGLTSDEIEDLAVAVRKQWGLGLGPLSNLTQLLESRGIIVAWLPNETKKVDAFSAWHSTRPAIFLVRGGNTGTRGRWDGAHELGHLVMHADVSAGNSQVEHEAHRFAGAFLVPKEPFLAEAPRRLDWAHLFEMKQRWGISLQALLRRGRDLGVLSDASYRRGFQYIGMRGWRTREPSEPNPERPQLIADSFAARPDVLTLEFVASRLQLYEKDIGELCGSSSQNAVSVAISRQCKETHMTNSKRIHVTKADGSGWQTKREGVPQPQSHHTTQTAAIDHAKLVAQIEKGEVVIHRRDGKIRDTDSYGHDPNPPRDRKH